MKLRTIASVTRVQQTLAFVFSADLARVLLLRVTKESWQKNKYNGIGGKIEARESKSQACTRELFEEAGIQISPSQLKNFGELISDTWHVHLFAVQATQEINPFTTKEGQTEWVKVSNLPSSCIDNLSWLIPCAKLQLSHPHQPYVVAQYPDHKLTDRKELS